ncbi:MAG: hypothetical protein ACJ8FD_19925 [Bradyrhizobium canariense]
MGRSLARSAPQRPGKNQRSIAQREQRSRAQTLIVLIFLISDCGDEPYEEPPSLSLAESDMNNALSLRKFEGGASR